MVRPVDKGSSHVEFIVGGQRFIFSENPVSNPGPFTGGYFAILAHHTTDSKWMNYHIIRWEQEPFCCW